MTGAASESPVQVCIRETASSECARALDRTASTEFWNMKFPGGFQSTGLVHGWTARPSEYAVEVSSASDVQAAVLFAGKHNLRLVVKGTGHDYMGRNTATSPGSLLVATFPMLGLTWGEGNETVTVEAGVPWQDVYIQAQTRGKFVLGGHCPTVGAAGGFPTGGGYGPSSRTYGTAADNMLAATVVTAAGDVVIASATSNADLFWALRGGGGGTFGIITDITYRAHPAPTLGGNVHGQVACSDESSFDGIFTDFIKFLPALITAHWGGTLSWSARNGNWGISLGLQYFGISQEDAHAIWAPFEAIVGNYQCSWDQRLSFEPMPTVQVDDGSRVLRLYPYAGARHPSTGDPAVDARLVDGFLGQVNQWSFGQAARWVPLVDVQEDPAGVASKLKALAKIPLVYQVLSLNKAMAGSSGPKDDVSMNPASRRAAVLLQANEHVANFFPALPQTAQTLQNLLKDGSVQHLFDAGFCTSPGGEFGSCLSSDLQSMPQAQIHACWSGVLQCFDERSQIFNGNFTPALRRAFPEGSYVNEGDYFEKNWQTAFWGENYPRLLAAKRHLDPEGLFVCRHCVGSEDWDEEGNCRRSSEEMRRRSEIDTEAMVFVA